jgi:hypothetical protein
VCLTTHPAPPATTALPSPDQLAWQDLEFGALFQHNIGEYDEERGSYACGNPKLPPPPAAMFAAPDLNVTAWFEAVKSAGATYALLTAQAGCGFLLYPSNSTLPDGTPYNYTVRESKYKGDLVGEFVAGAREAGLKVGVYCVVNNNYFLSVGNGKVAPMTAPGQVVVTQAQCNNLVLAQLKELWSQYGDLVVLWFDGGVPDGLSPSTASLVNTLQPHAATFQSPPGVRSPVRWIGTESGQAPEPNWCSANSSVDFGPGAADAPMYVPAEASLRSPAAAAFWHVFHSTVGSSAAVCTTETPVFCSNATSAATYVYVSLSSLSLCVCVSAPSSNHATRFFRPRLVLLAWVHRRTSPCQALANGTGDQARQVTSRTPLLDDEAHLPAVMRLLV